MPALQVKDFPEDLYEELRACASRNDRSMSQQTLRILREYLRAYREYGEDVGLIYAGYARSAESGGCRLPTDDDRMRRIARKRIVFERIDALPVFDVPSGFPSADEVVRQMREERDDRIACEQGEPR